MKEDRLTGLALMAMNKNRFNLDGVLLDNFTRKKARRLNLLLEYRFIQFSYEMRLELITHVNIFFFFCSCSCTESLCLSPHPLHMILNYSDNAHMFCDLKNRV